MKLSFLTREIVLLIVIVFGSKYMENTSMHSSAWFLLFLALHKRVQNLFCHPLLWFLISQYISEISGKRQRKHWHFYFHKL